MDTAAGIGSAHRKTEGGTEAMNRGWFTIFGGLGIIITILAPEAPVPPEWHGFMNKVPIAISSFLTYMGWQAYEKNPDGTKNTGAGTGDGKAAVVVVAPPVKPEEPLIKP